MSLFDAGKIGHTTSLTDLLKIEHCPELLRLTCPQSGIPVWSTLRIAFLREVMGDLLFDSGMRVPPPRVGPLTKVVTLGRTILRNSAVMASGGARADLLINTDGIGDSLRENRWYNRYADPFGDLPSGQAVVLTDLHEWQIHEPRHNERLIYHAPLQVAAALLGRVPNREAKRLAEAATALAFDRAQDVLAWHVDEDRRKTFVRWATRKIAAIPLRYRAYLRLLAHVQPKLVLTLAGCYGANAPLFAAAHDAGIVTGEFQHGSISTGHDAYNFAPAVHSSDAYRRTLPRYLLTYGPWWNEQVTAPIECVAIGNPARTEKMRSISTDMANRHEILVLSDGIAFNLYLKLAQTIAAAVTGTGLKVVLRPHPQERNRVVQRFGGQIGNIRIDTTPDIYASFQKAKAVVSEVSTGLFEAVGLAERIVLLDTVRSRFAFPRHPFTSANSTDEVIERICGPILPAPKVSASALWAENWRENYRWFLQEKVGIGS